MRENFMQLLTAGQTLTNGDVDLNNTFFSTHPSGTTQNPNYTIMLHSFMGSGNQEESINLTVNGLTFDIAPSSLISMPIESITVNSYKLITTGGTYVSAPGASTLTKNPGVIVFGHAIKKSMF